MGDTFIIVIAIGLSAVLLFVFPMMSLADRTDDISGIALQAETEEYVNKVSTTGVITLDDTDQFMQTISASGNSYEVDIQLYLLDENPGVKLTQAEMTKIGENLYYTYYTTQIQDALNENGRIRLKQGDMIVVEVKNTNQTIAEQLWNLIFQLTGNDAYKLKAQESAIVTVNGSN